MVEQFKKFWKPEWNDKAKQLGKTPHEIITMASLIETESRIDEERPVVASVIYNRLNKGIALGLDQTVVYIAKMENRWDGTINKSDLDSTSPYNTRKFPGLPPGPISSVTESSINAALNPATTDYIYYVLNVEKMTARIISILPLVNLRKEKPPIKCGWNSKEPKNASRKRIIINSFQGTFKSFCCLI